MAYTTITATTIGLADGDTSPSPVDGTVRITPRFPAAATESGFTVSGPVVVTVTGGEMSETQIPSMEGTTGVVEFHLYDRNAGPVRMPATEIPLDPDTTVSLNEFMPVGVDPVSGTVFVKGEPGPEGPRGPEGPQGIPGPEGEQGEVGPEGPEGPIGETGGIGPDGPEGPQGDPGVDGTGIEVKDTLDSEAELPEEGDVGDAYLINRDLYVWSASSSGWSNAGTLQGPKGEQGAPGVDGNDGADGEVGAAGADGQDGEDGASAFEVAVAEGFTGTEAEWLTSLIGPEGPAGADGEEGPQGPKGDNASGLPEGGEPGQVPTRTEDGGSEWSEVVDLMPDMDIYDSEPDRGLIAPEIAALMVKSTADTTYATPDPRPEAIVRRDDDGAAAFTHVTIDEPTEDNHATTKAYVDAQPSDPLVYLDRARVAVAFPAERVASEGYVAPQGFSVNPDENRLYVSYGAGSDSTQRIEIRDLTTGDRLDYKVLEADPQSYSESLPYFRNEQDQLCFVVWLKASASMPTEYKIYNWDKDALSSGIEINGKVRGDHFGELFVTSDAYGHSGSTFWVYSWDSIKSGDPELLQSVPMSNAGPMPAKLQGQTTIGSHFLTFGGDPTEDPTVTVHNNLGRLKSMRRWTRSDLARVISDTSPWEITTPSFAWEAEGMTNQDGIIYTGHYVSGLSVPSDVATKQIVILEHGDPSSPAMAPLPVTGGQSHTAWIDVTVDPDCTVLFPFQARVNGDSIQVRGRVGPLVGTTFPSGVGKVIGRLPDGMLPASPQQFPGTSQGADPFILKINVEANGDLKVFSAGNWTYVDLSAMTNVYML